MAVNRKIIATPFLLIRGVFRKTRWDNFMGGLIFGAIFSLAVNIITVQVQESINQQLYLEALENEIGIHLLHSVQNTDKNKRIIDNSTPPNFYEQPFIYQTRVWNNSDGLRYLVKLNPEVQLAISAYYEYIVQPANGISIRNYELMDEKSKNCYWDFEILANNVKDQCVADYRSYLNVVNLGNLQIGEQSGDLLKIFHPTQDRLNDPIMRLLIGNKSVKFLQHQ